MAGRPTGTLQAYRLDANAAGDPVKGAKVAAGGGSGTTNGRGKVELTLPGRAAKATATRSGYVADTLRLRAR